MFVRYLVGTAICIAPSSSKNRKLCGKVNMTRENIKKLCGKLNIIGEYIGNYATQ